MNKESLVMGVAGVLLGLMAGWMIGSQQAAGRVIAPAAQQQIAAPASGQATPPAPTVDETRVAQLKAEADRNPRSSAPRAALGNLYFDAERFDEAVRWYTAALEIDPREVNVSTDLGIAYYYTNQPDKALEQFDHSLAVDPKHSKTLLNIGVVRAWGKRDLEGAAKAFERVIEIAPASEEAARAKLGLEGIRAAHPGAASVTGAKPPKTSN